MGFKVARNLSELARIEQPSRRVNGAGENPGAGCTALTLRKVLGPGLCESGSGATAASRGGHRMGALEHGRPEPIPGPGASFAAQFSAKERLLPAAWGALFEPEAPASSGFAAASGAAAPQRLGALAQWRRVSVESLVFEARTQSDGMIALCKGDVALGLRRSNGEFRVDRHVCGPAWLEVSAGWLGGVHTQDALALSEAMLMVLPRQALAAWAGESASLWGLLGSVLARELADAASRNQDLMHKDAGARLATWLCRRALADLAEGVRPKVVLPTIKRDLASQLAITPETLSRLMRRFSEAGLIRVSGYTVDLLDLAGLRRCALATL